MGSAGSGPFPCRLRSLSIPVSKIAPPICSAMPTPRSERLPLKPQHMIPARAPVQRPLAQSPHTAAHAQLGENAIHKATRDISRLVAVEFKTHEGLGATRAQVTQITGGLARNQVPDCCDFFVDLRTTPNLDHVAVIAEIRARLESEVTVHSHRYEPVATNASELVVRAALEVADASAGVGSVTTSDWAFLKGIPAVKVGPGNTNRSHRPNEYLLLSELEAGAAFYSRFVHTYFRMAPTEIAYV